MFQVRSGSLVGVGPTPGLALRAFWRRCEREVLAQGFESGNAFEALPWRRQAAVRRRASHSQKEPT